jgi:hypothetical protein
MPLKVAPDPNNPGKFIWVDSATGQPATQPGGPNTPYVAPSDTTNVNIDPNASKTTAPTTAPTTQPTGPAAGPASPGTPSVGGFSVAQIIAPSDEELLQAHADVAKLWDQIHTQQDLVTKLQNDPATVGNPASLTAATSTLNGLYSSLSQGMQRVETANAARSKTLTDAIHNGTVDPGQVDVAKSTAAKADADGQLARTQAKVLDEGSDGQKALVAAQATQASAQAASALATAAATTAKTPAEIDQLNAQAKALNAQADSTNALLPGLIDKQKAEIGLTTAQTDLTGSQSQLAKAQATQATANAGLTDAQTAQTKAQTSTLLPAQVGLAGAQAGLAGAQTAQAQAGIEKDKLGPLYGLQDQIKAIQTIQQQVFGPGGSGDPNEANDLLKQFTTATLSGTTPYAANVAAANAGLTAFGTQASLTNAAQAAAASRANQYTGTAGSVLGSLLGVMKDAPAGSQALGPAFADAMGQIQQATGGPSQFTPPQQPQAPVLPALLQKLAGQGTPTGPGQPQPQPQPQPQLRPQPQPQPQPQSTGPTTSAPVTINIGGQGQGQTQSPPQQFPGLAQGSSAQGTALSAGPGLPMPSMLQNYAPPTTDYVHQLWGNELGSGAVRSPYAAMGQAS